MAVIQIAALLLAIVALFSYLNQRVTQLPNTIVVMMVTAIVSFSIMLLGKLGWDSLVFQSSTLRQIDQPLLMQAALSVMMFAAVMQLNIAELKQLRLVVILLGVLSSAISYGVIAAICWVVLHALDIPILFSYCLLFAVIITPTDSLGLLSILRSIRLHKVLEATISGESVLNNVISIVSYLIIILVAPWLDTPNYLDAILPASISILGGICFGIVLGLLIAFFLRTSEQQYPSSMTLTLAFSLGGYALASWLALSAPLALAVAGIFVARNGILQEPAREQLKVFWNVLMEWLLLVLLLIMGMELLLLPIRVEYLLAVLAIIPAVLLARYVGVGLPMLLVRKTHRFTGLMAQVMTWGALRGGISVALLLSIPLTLTREIMSVIAYFIIIFSMVVQGLILTRVLEDAR